MSERVPQASDAVPVKWPPLSQIKASLIEAVRDNDLTDAIYHVTCWRQFVSNELRGIKMDVKEDAK